MFTVLVLVPLISLPANGPRLIAEVTIKINCTHPNLSDTEVDVIGEVLEDLNFKSITRQKLDEAGFGKEIEIEIIEE
jgi:hypothetical protein